MYGRYLFEVCNRLLASLAAPSTLTLYGSGPRLDDSAVIGVSQSGRGEDVVSYVEHDRGQGALSVAIVNDAASPLAAAAEHVLACLASPDMSVPATKTVTAQMALLALLSASLERADRAEAMLESLPQAIAAALEQREAARTLADALRP